jgi:glycosyltransferase involved in cell wall biosynthesis
MRILYDGHIYTVQASGGVNRYFANLINRLPQDYVPVLTASEQRSVNFPTHPNLKTFFLKRHRPGVIFRPLEGYYFQVVYALQKFDLIHPTYYLLLNQQDMNQFRLPVVITVYDMIHEIFYPDSDHIEPKRKAVNASQAIICISESTKKDLLERCSIPEEQVSVIYLASEINIDLSYGSEPVPNQPYYLYVGGRASYKNFDRLLTAFAKVASAQADVKLCVVGSAFSELESKLLAELNLIDRIERYDHVNDEHLAKLYRCSIALIYPSLYEGFGIPPLEAMSCGTVAVAANSSSLPEVVGDAGILFDPNSTIELADIMLSLLNNSSERDALIIKGYQRAKLFSWEKVVSQTIDVYRKVSS